MPAPYRRIIPGDWITLDRVVQEIWAILNADTTVSDMVSDITVGSSDLVLVSDGLSDCESEQKVISDALSDVISDLLWMQSDLTVLAGSAGMTYKTIKATAQTEGDLHLSDGSTWAISKALIKYIHVVTSSTDWDMFILQNDNGYSTDDANVPKMKIAGNIVGNATLWLDLPYEDEDASDEVHLYYLDNSGSNTADIYIKALELA